MGSARAEDPLGKVVFFTKLAQDRPRKAQYSAGAVFSALSTGGCTEQILKRVTLQFMFDVEEQFADQVRSRHRKGVCFLFFGFYFW